jgi:hypothetical protein
MIFGLQMYQRCPGDDCLRSIFLILRLRIDAIVHYNVVWKNFVQHEDARFNTRSGRVQMRGMQRGQSGAEAAFGVAGLGAVLL